MDRIVQKGALFIADAHYPHHGEEFLVLLRHIDADATRVPQLFLMGDVFDLLFGYNDYIVRFSQEAVALVRSISRKIPVYYFEGNHDFCLSPLFPDATVFAYLDQPVRFVFEGKTLALSHGDRFDTGAGYKLYTFLLRNRVTLRLLRPWQKRIIDGQMRKLAQKNICRTYEGFEKKAARILRRYEDVDLVVEGHFHQGKKVGKYVSLPSLACQRQIGVAESGGEIVFVDVERWLTQPSF